MDFKGVLEFFATTDIGRIILLIIAASVAGGVLLWRDNNRLRTLRLKLSGEQSERDDQLEQKRLDNEQKEHDRRAVSDSENRALTRRLADQYDRVITILERMDLRQAEQNEMAREAKTDFEALSIRTGNIHKGLGIAIGKIDAGQEASKHRSEGLEKLVVENDKITWGMINTRTQHLEGRVETSIGKQTEHHTQQMSSLDDVLKQLQDLGKKVVAIQKHNEESRVNALKGDEILKRLGEIYEIVRTAKKTGPLNPDVVATVHDPLARPTVADNVPLVSEALGLTKKTDPLPPTEPPVAKVEPLITPPAVHDTAQLVVTPKPEGT